MDHNKTKGDGDMLVVRNEWNLVDEREKRDPEGNKH